MRNNGQKITVDFNPQDEVVLVVDMKTKKPGCVLLQAFYSPDDAGSRPGRVVKWHAEQLRQKREREKQCN